MPVLQGIQEFYGYIPEPCVDLVAERLNVYPSQIYGVLTFYAQFHLEAARQVYRSYLHGNRLSRQGRRADCRHHR